MQKTIAVNLIAKVGQFDQGLGRAGARVGKFGSETERAARKASSAANGLAATAAVAGKAILLGIGGAMAVSAKAAVEYESSLTGVAKTTDLAGNAFDRANSPLAQFGDRLRNLSLDIPVNVNELARIAELGGQLGIAVPDLVNFTETIAKLGVTTNLSAEEGATSIARFMNIMRTETSDVGRIGSTIVELGNNFATTESEILSFGLRLAPIGATVGATEAEVLGLSTALTSLGIPAERGGTALQRVFIRMKEAIDTGNDSLTGFAETAQMSREEFEALFRLSPARAFAAFVEGLDAINRSGGNVFQTLEDLQLSEQRTTATLLATASGYEVVEQAIEDADGAYRDNIALNEEAALRFGTNASQIQLLGNAFTDLKIEIGNSLIGRGGLIAFTDTAQAFLEIVGENIEAIGGFTKALAGVAVASTALGLKRIVTSLVAKVVAWRQLSVAVKQGGVALAGTQRVLAGMSIAMTTAMGVAGLLAAAWAWQAIKAAELRAQVRQLNDEIARGEDPVDALIASMRESGEINADFEDALARQGVSVRQWATAMLEGKGAVDELFASTEGRTLAKGMSMTRLFPMDVTRELNAVTEASTAANEIIAELMRSKKNEIREEIMNLESSANLTFNEIDHLADRMLDFFGLDVSGSEVARWLSGEQQLRADFGWGDELIEETEQTEQSFLDIISGMGEEGTEFLTQMWDDAAAAVDEYETGVEAAFQEIVDEIRGAFPAWDEYTQATEISLQDATDSQEAYLADLKDWRLGRDLILAGASDETFEWIEQMPLELRAGLARMAIAGDEGFAEFLAKWNANWETALEEEREVLIRESPEIMRQGANAILDAMIESVTGSDKPELTGKQILEGIQNGLMEQGLSLNELFMAMDTRDMLAFFERLGIDLSVALGQGLVTGLDGQGNAIGSSVDRLNKRFKEELESGVEVKSPSRYTFRIGTMLGQGLRLGWENEMMDFNSVRPVERAIQPNAAFTPTIHVEGGGGSSSRTLNFAPNIIHPNTKNLKEDLRLATVMAGSASEFGG